MKNLRCLIVGVTTVGDAASFGNVGIMARQAFAQGTLSGSRPIVCGQGVTSNGGYGTEGGTQGLVMEVDGPDGFRAGVRAQLKAGADFIRGREVGRSGRARQGSVGQHCQFANGPDRRPGRSSRETMTGAGNGGAL